MRRVGEDQAAAFANDLWEQMRDRVQTEPDLMLRDAFVHIVGEYLEEDGILEDLEVCYHRAQVGRRSMEVAGYNISSDGTILDLVTHHIGLYGSTVPRESVRRQLRRAEVFAERCREGVHRDMEESSPCFDMAQHIHSTWPGLERIRIFFFTDGRVTGDPVTEGVAAGLPVIHELWDVTRLGRLVTSGQPDDVVIDLEALGHPVPCLPATQPGAEYECLMALLPGPLLAELYERYGAQLLQRNVRAFLQAKGKVNKGINETVRREPSRFLAYNNGISATATNVATVPAADGTLRISAITGLQIVNGGQTTASLHHAWKRDGADLSRVTVPAKITVVQDGLLDELVPRISRYANSQNAVREDDFEANSPFHADLESLSRTVWAPVLVGSKQTRWYYERARGQYQVDISRQPTAARKRMFRQENPNNQRFSKTDAAIYEMTYLRRPHDVCLGAQKCFQRWTVEVVNQQTERPDPAYFQSLVAKGILFERSRDLVNRMKLGAYLRQTTAYVVALLVERAGGELALNRIWRLQDLPQAVVRAVTDLARPVRAVITNPPASGNVTEWCKKEGCWKAMHELDWELPPDVM